MQDLILLCLFEFTFSGELNFGLCINKTIEFEYNMIFIHRSFQEKLICDLVCTTACYITFHVLEG